MLGPGELSQQPAPIIGREAALARVRGLVDPVPELIAAAADLIAATVLAMRGDSDTARRHADRAHENAESDTPL